MNDAEQIELERLERRHSTPQQLALQGRIILAAARGQNNNQIARALGVSVDTVHSWPWINWQSVSLEDISVSEHLTDIYGPDDLRRSRWNKPAR